LVYGASFYMGEICLAAQAGAEVSVLIAHMIADHLDLSPDHSNPLNEPW